MSRFVGLSRIAAALILVALAATIALGLGETAAPARAAPARAAQTPANPAGASDLSLYRAIVQRVRRHEPYEAAAVAELRAGHYPLKPFVAVRPPLLALSLARLPDEKTADLCLALLAMGVVGAWVYRLGKDQPRPAILAASALVIFLGVGSDMAGGGASLFHESWAGLLIALSLAVRSQKHFAAAVLLGLLAALIRELALPYLAVMCLFALLERRRLEALAFAGAGLVALAALALHAAALAPLVGIHDPASQGWVGIGGWGFVLATGRWNLLVVMAGAWISAIVAPMALLGAAGWRGPYGLRLFALLAGYTLGFMVIGRPENLYWGLMVAPLMGVGLCLAPPALGDLLGRVAHREPVRP